MKPFRDLKFKKIPNSLPTAVKRFGNGFEIEVCKLAADSFTLRVYHYPEQAYEPVSYSPLQIIGMIKSSYSSYEICRAMYKINRLSKDEIPAEEGWYLNTAISNIPVYCN